VTVAVDVTPMTTEEEESGGTVEVVVVDSTWAASSISWTRTIRHFGPARSIFGNVSTKGFFPERRPDDDLLAAAGLRPGFAYLSFEIRAVVCS
jgi:hypothetical protein